MRLFYMVTSFLRGYEMSCISKKIISYTHILTNRLSYRDIGGYIIETLKMRENASKTNRVHS